MRRAGSPIDDARSRTRTGPTTTRPPITFREHAERWLTNRTLKPRSRYHYRKMLDSKLLPTFGDITLKHITADLVDDWYYRLGDSAPTSRAHAYGLLRTILGDAVQRRLITHNPCHIRGAGNVKRASGWSRRLCRNLKRSLRPCRSATD